MSRKRISSFVLAAGCLFAGTLVYIIFRPTSLLMFRWSDSLGLTGAIASLRTLSGFDRYLPDWIVYSLPFALWVSFYLFLLRGIWWGSSSTARHIWIWCVPVIAISAEIAQSLGLIPGRFDQVDLIAIILCVALYSVAFHYRKSGCHLEQK